MSREMVDMQKICIRGIYWSTHGGIKPKMKAVYSRKIRRPYHRRAIPEFKNIFGRRTTSLNEMVNYTWSENHAHRSLMNKGVYRNKPMDVYKPYEEITCLFYPYRKPVRNNNTKYDCSLSLSLFRNGRRIFK